MWYSSPRNGLDIDILVDIPFFLLVVIIIHIIRLDFSTQVPCRTEKKGNVDAAQGIIDGCNQESISRKEKSRKSQRRILWQTNLVRWTAQIQEASTTDEPLGHRRPPLLNGKRHCEKASASKLSLILRLSQRCRTHQK
jgi:hypothetical protein